MQLKRPQRKWPSVLVALVNEVLRSKTCELVAFTQLKDSVYGRANRLKTLFACGTECLARQDFLHIAFDGHSMRAGLGRQFVRHFDGHVHFVSLYAHWPRFRAI